jgi:hypothetical protein
MAEPCFCRASEFGAPGASMCRAGRATPMAEPSFYRASDLCVRLAERPRWRNLVSVALRSSEPRERLCVGLVERPRWRSLVSVALRSLLPRARLCVGLVERPRWRSLVSVALRTSHYWSVVAQPLPVPSNKSSRRRTNLRHHTIAVYAGISAFFLGDTAVAKCVSPNDHSPKVARP